MVTYRFFVQRPDYAEIGNQYSITNKLKQQQQQTTTTRKVFQFQKSKYFKSGT